MNEGPDWMLMYGVDEMGEQCPRCKKERSMDEYGTNYRCAECQLRAVKKYKDKVIAGLEKEIEKLNEYAYLLQTGLSDYEARGTVWPEKADSPNPPSPPQTPQDE